MGFGIRVGFGPFQSRDDASGDVCWLTGSLSQADGQREVGRPRLHRLLRSFLALWRRMPMASLPPVTLESIADQAGTEVGFDGLTVFRAAAHDRGAPVLSLPVLGLMAQWPVDCSPGGPA